MRLRGPKLIDTKHLDVCKSINALRVAAAHNKDRNSVKKWNLNPDTAIGVYFVCINYNSQYS